MIAPAGGGIYAITHAATGRLYVGSACNVSRRWGEHKSALSRGCHGNAKLQNGWNKHGAGAFTFSILEDVVDPADLIAREQAWMDATAPFYNIRNVAESNLGLVHSAETRARMSVTATGMSAEHRQKLSAAASARALLSDEARQRISAAQKGRKHSAESRQRMSLAAKARPPASDEARIRMSVAQKARPPISAETRMRLSIALTGRTVSDETRQRISVAKKGMSAETRQRISVAAKARCARAKREASA